MLQLDKTHMKMGYSYRKEYAPQRGSIFFPLKVDPLITENNFNQFELRNHYIKICQYVYLLKSQNFYVRNITWLQ